MRIFQPLMIFPTAASTCDLWVQSMGENLYRHVHHQLRKLYLKEQQKLEYEAIQRSQPIMFEVMIGN